MSPDDAPIGFLLVDKPGGVTSHDVVGRTRAIARTKRVGHAGTLDPMATGLLILAVGRATKLLGHIAQSAKSYRATIRLGVATDTDDALGERVGGADASRLTEAEIVAGMTALTGDIDQVPSTFSAVKVDGRRAYDRARSGEEVVLAARRVVIDRFDIVAPPRPHGAVVDVDVVVDCSSGTYVRALARDLGHALGVGGHLTVLRRETIGPFAVSAAVDVFPQGTVPAGSARPPIPEELRAEVARHVIPVTEVMRAALPSRTVPAQVAADLRYGRPIPATGTAGTVAVFDESSELLALVRDDEGHAKPVLVWQAAG